MISWRWVRILAFLAGAAFLAWIMVRDPWLLTLALTLAGIAADRGVVLLPVSDWWRAVFGVPVAAGVVMLWVSEGRGLVLLPWGLALLLLHLAVKGMVLRGPH